MRIHTDGQQKPTQIEGRTIARRTVRTLIRNAAALMHEARSKTWNAYDAWDAGDGADALRLLGEARQLLKEYQDLCDLAMIDLNHIILGTIYQPSNEKSADQHHFERYMQAQRAADEKAGKRRKQSKSRRKVDDDRR